jgi:hypothetical protein
VYAVVAYSGLVALIFSTQKEVPMKTKRMTLIRSMYMIPSIICFIVLAGSGVDITMETIDTTIRDLNASTVWTEETTRTFTLENPIWVTLHYMFALILVVYLFSQVLSMLTAKD